MVRMFRNFWGPQYAGVGGRLKKMWELAIQPGNFPFIIGLSSAALLLGNIPVTQYINREAIMEEKKRRTGSYH